MKDFDIEVRNLLSDAEESVSPRVWEGVVAGLDRRRKIVSFWRWAGASVAAAAAVAAGFVFLRPVEDHSQPTSIFIVQSSEEAPQEAPSAINPQEEEVLPSIGKQLAGKQVRTALLLQEQPALPEPVKEEAAPAAEEAPVAEEVPETAVPAEAVSSEVSAHSRLEQLAREQKESFRRGFAVTASGNVQSNQRQQTGSSVVPRQFGAPALQQGEGIYNASPETSFTLPFSAGVGLTYYFAPRWAVGAGVRYSFLGRTFIGDYDSGEGFKIIGTDIDNNQHWLGIPVNVYFDFLNQGRWHVHAFTGGAIDFLLRNDYLVHNTPKDIHYVERVSAPQWSVNLGVGLEYQLSPYVSLYLDPQFRYYFGTENQPRSLRTIQPLRFDIEAGLRFNLGK